MKTITIYSTPSCHFCHAAKEFLKSKDIAFTDYDVTADPEKRKEMLERSGQLGVPVIFVDDEMIIGFDQKKLSELAGIA